MSNFVFNFSPLGACLITPFSAPDKRGEFVKDFNSEELRKGGINFVIHEVLNVRSKKGVLRGMHFQTNKPQAKIVRCLRGSIIDVIVDVRADSATFGEYEMYELNGGRVQSLYIPEGFAHGYLVLQDDTLVQYYCNNLYDSGSDGGIHFLDPFVGIEWPWKRIGGQKKVIVSDKDRAMPTLREWAEKQKEESEASLPLTPIKYKCIGCQEERDENEVYGVAIETKVDYPEGVPRLFTHIGYGYRRSKAAVHLCRECSDRFCSAPRYKRKEVKEDDAQIR